MKKDHRLARIGSCTIHAFSKQVGHCQSQSLTEGPIRDPPDDKSALSAQTMYVIYRAAHNRLRQGPDSLPSVSGGSRLHNPEDSGGSIPECSDMPLSVRQKKRIQIRLLGNITTRHHYTTQTLSGGPIRLLFNPPTSTTNLVTTIVGSNNHSLNSCFPFPSFPKLCLDTYAF